MVTAAAAAGQRVMQAEAWLLDNYYLIEQQIALARRHLPRGYSRELPRLANGLSAGFPRIYELALDLIAHQDGRVDRDNAAAFLAAYQTVDPLNLGELWAFPIMLRLGLLENVRRVASRIARRREERDTAIAWADRILTAAGEEPKRLVHVLAEFANATVPLTAPFVEDFYARLQAQGPALALVQAWLEHQLSDQGLSAVQLLEVASRSAAADQISIANSIGSLRFISALDWGTFVEDLSLVESDAAPRSRAGLRRPGFPHPRPVSARRRGRCPRQCPRRTGRGAGRGPARSRRRSSRRVSTTGLPTSATTSSTRAGRPSNARWRARCRSRCASLVWVVLSVSSLYLAPMLILTAIAVAVPLVLVAEPEQGWGWYVFFVIVGLLAASTVVVPIVNLLVTSRCLPECCRAWTSPKASRPPTERWWSCRHWWAVPRTCRTFWRPWRSDISATAIPISSLPCSPISAMPPSVARPDDDELVGLARDGIEALNEQYSEDRPDIFYLFHRPRIWNPRDRVWMGWERKRGKLEQFNALLLQSRAALAAGGGGGAADAPGGSAPADAAAAFSDIVGDRSILGSIRYVITLDTDTQLPRDTARTLIGNMAHPLNRPVYDARKGRVIDGYGILQPRASISLASSTSSRFTRLFAGEAGIDPYTREVSDVYQDLFGEGSFVGKGIYDVAAFSQAVNGRFPENLILSHDLLESGYARSALVADVDLIEEHPTTYPMEASRRHRWTRGDWQLAGWLLPRVPGPGGKRQPNPLALLSVWKLWDNLRRSLVPAALVALCVGGWLFAVGPSWLWPVLTAGALFLPSLVTAALEFVRKPAERAWWLHLVLTGNSLAQPLLRALLGLMMLPYDALIYLNAILRSARQYARHPAGVAGLVPPLLRPPERSA